MKRHRHDQVPIARFHDGSGPSNEKIGQERLEPGGAPVLVAGNHFPHKTLGRTGCPREIEIQLHIPAIAALELGRNITREGETATLTEGWDDEFDRASAPPAFGTDIALLCGRPIGCANLTDIGKE